MNINIHNYGECFLLYVDNELTEAERAAVEIFVQQNPQLGEEFMLLQQAILKPEEKVFVHKEDLYKNEHAISIANCQEYFLLYVDNELPTKEKEEVEKFVLQHPAVQDEFTLLQQTRLKSEKVTFKFKSSLYRKEETARISTAFTWMRMAAAAAIIGLVTTLWITYSSNDVIQPPVTQATDEPRIATSTAADVASKRSIGSSADKTAALSNNTARKVEKVIPTKKKATEAVPDKIVAAVKQTQPDIQANNDNLNNLPVPENTKARTVETPKNTTDTRSDVALTMHDTKGAEGSNYMQHAVYNEIDTKQNEEDKTIYIGGAEINKNKLRGLLKKASTFLDKRIKKTEIEKTVQIASFEISTQ